MHHSNWIKHIMMLYSPQRIMEYKHKVSIYKAMYLYPWLLFLSFYLFYPFFLPFTQYTCKNLQFFVFKFSWHHPFFNYQGFVIVYQYCVVPPSLLIIIFMSHLYLVNFRFSLSFLSSFVFTTFFAPSPQALTFAIINQSQMTIGKPIAHWEAANIVMPLMINSNEIKSSSLRFGKIY